jgi:hypothetical protein
MGAMKHRTDAYWPTRFMLAAGVIATALVVLAAGVAVAWSQDCFSCDYPAVLGLPSGVLLPAIGVALALFGLVWMIRIFRGPRDEPPAWRHRDR